MFVDIWFLVVMVAMSAGFGFFMGFVFMIQPNQPIDRYEPPQYHLPVYRNDKGMITTHPEYGSANAFTTHGEYGDVVATKPKTSRKAKVKVNAG